MKKKPGQFMNRMVAVVMTAAILFTILMTVIFCIKENVPDTLITCFFAFIAAEGGCMAWIKNVKTKNEGTIIEEGNEDE